MTSSTRFRVWLPALVIVGLLVAGFYYRAALLPYLHGSEGNSEVSGEVHAIPNTPPPMPTALATAAANTAVPDTAAPDTAVSDTALPDTAAIVTIAPRAGELNALESPIATPDPTPTHAAQPRPLVSRELIATDLLSVDNTGAPVDHAVTGVALSADGQIIAFASRATNLRPYNLPTSEESAYNPNGYEQIYVMDRAQNRLELITLGKDGAPGNGWSSAPALSPDGRFVAFYSWAANLVSGDTNAVQDAFLYDRVTASMTRVSVSDAGRQGNDRSGDSRAGVRPALSADGNLIAFHSRAGNLVNTDTPITGNQVYLHNRVAGTTTLISRAADGTPGNGDSIQPTLSADGRVLAFQSQATNLFDHLPAGDEVVSPPTAPSIAPSPWQIWRFDRTAENGENDGARAWTLVSRTAERSGNGDSTWPVLAGDGQRLAFQSVATNLVVPDLNQAADILLYDHALNASDNAAASDTSPLRRVSITSMGVPGNREATTPAISLDGRLVAFASTATNLVGGDTNAVTDIFVHDLTTRHTSRVSVGVTGLWTGIEADGPARDLPALSADGGLVAFLSPAPNLLPSARVTDGTPDAGTQDPSAAQAYLHARQTPATYAVAGRIVDNRGQPIAGAVIQAGPHRATSDATGDYRLPALVGGTYALTVAHSRYTFSPPRRITSVLRDTGDVDFTGFAGVDQARAFLDLPFAYDGSIATFLQSLRDTAEGGLVDAWFDHAYPDYS
ncbi:MAG: carboxypeptidase regulatory-like domain-containing protein, partial [Litorilinea sp.]